MLYELCASVKEEGKKALMTILGIIDNGLYNTYREWRWNRREEKLMKAGYYGDKDIYGPTKADNFD